MLVLKVQRLVQQVEGVCCSDVDAFGVREVRDAFDDRDHETRLGAHGHQQAVLRMQRFQRGVFLVFEERNDWLRQRDEPIEAVRLEENLVRLRSLQREVAVGLGVEQVTTDRVLAVAHVLHDVVRQVLEVGEVGDDSFFKGRLDGRSG